jgi:hypothetical protein
MLKVNVGLARKLSRDFNSTGFTINLEGEVLAPVNETETVVERIQEFYDLAEEALLRQIERYQSDEAIASRDEPTVTAAPLPAKPTARSAKAEETTTHSPSRLPNSAQTASGESATNKQIQFLLNLSKRSGLTTPQLENRIADILGQRTGLYDLSKRDAGAVLDALTADRDVPAKSAR